MTEQVLPESLQLPARCSGIEPMSGWADAPGMLTASRLRRLMREVHVDARADFRERNAA